MSTKVLITSLLALCLLQSCTMYSLNTAASTLLLKPKSDITRHRQVSISHLSHIGLFIDKETVQQNSSLTDNPLLKTRLNELSQGAKQAVASTFAKHTAMDKPKSVVRSVDFVIHAQIIDMTLTELPEPVIINKDSNEEQEIVLIPTDHLQLTLVLKDARSDQLIDIAYVQTRSGQLEYKKGYAKFAEYSIGQYLKAITQ